MLPVTVAGPRRNYTGFQTPRSLVNEKEDMVAGKNRQASRRANKSSSRALSSARRRW